MEEGNDAARGYVEKAGSSKKRTLVVVLLFLSAKDDAASAFAGFTPNLQHTTKETTTTTAVDKKVLSLDPWRPDKVVNTAASSQCSAKREREALALSGHVDTDEFTYTKGEFLGKGWMLSALSRFPGLISYCQ